jgi:hypothetical protein
VTSVSRQRSRVRMHIGPQYRKPGLEASPTVVQPKMSWCHEPKMRRLHDGTGETMDSSILIIKYCGCITFYWKIITTVVPKDFHRKFLHNIRQINFDFILHYRLKPNICEKLTKSPNLLAQAIFLLK